MRFRRRAPQTSLWASPVSSKRRTGQTRCSALFRATRPEIELVIEIDQNGMLAHDERTLLVSAPAHRRRPAGVARQYGLPGVQGRSARTGSSRSGPRRPPSLDQVGVHFAVAEPSGWRPDNRVSGEDRRITKSRQLGPDGGWRTSETRPVHSSARAVPWLLQTLPPRTNSAPSPVRSP